MKESELREISTCHLCGKKIGKTKLPLFWRIRVQRYGIDMNAVQRQEGLAMMLGGNGFLASVMGPDEDMAKIIDENEVTVCEDCAMKNPLLFQLLGD